MALTLIKVPDGFDVWGKTKVFAFDVTFDTSYPLTAGYVINAPDVGLSSFKGIQVLGGNKAAGGVIAHADLASVSTESFMATSLALRLFYPTGGGTAPATVTAPVAGAGAGTIAVTNGAITAGAVSVAGSAVGTLTAGADTVDIASNVAVPSTGLTASAANPTQATTTAVFTGSGGGGLVAGIAKEVGNTTNVSSITIRILFMGQ